MFLQHFFLFFYSFRMKLKRDTWLGLWFKVQMRNNFARDSVQIHKMNAIDTLHICIVKENVSRFFGLYAIP